MQARRLVYVALFALAMAYVEAAVVVYLRLVYGITDLVRDVAAYDPALAAIEVGREAATLVMLLAVGLAAGRSAQARAGFTLFAFGLWDILYYSWLRILIGWPRTLLDPDLLFLIPLPWWGPVLAPVLISVLSIAAGWLAVARDDRGIGLDPGRAGWACVAGGVLAALYAFMADALKALPASPEALSRLRPSPFPWPVYSAGLLLMSLALWRAARFTLRHPAR
ncbi:MAG TPA: hypothetical protein VGV60_12305 [Candidatus Polarisedimenticolia bacterium]|nr:hypothetical protein [Candidatus Polarisedimenticolia bacterium]